MTKRLLTSAALGCGMAVTMTAAGLPAYAVPAPTGSSPVVRDLTNAELQQVFRDLLPHVDGSASAGVVATPPSVDLEGKQTTVLPVHFSGDRSIVSLGELMYHEGVYGVSGEQVVHHQGVRWTPRALLEQEDVRRVRRWLGLDITGTAWRLLPDQGAEWVETMHPGALFRAEVYEMVREPDTTGQMSFTPPVGDTPGHLALAVIDDDSTSTYRAVSRTGYRLSVVGPGDAAGQTATGALPAISGATIESIASWVPVADPSRVEGWKGVTTYAYGPNRAVLPDPTGYISGRLYGNVTMTHAMNRRVAHQLRFLRSRVQRALLNHGPLAARRLMRRQSDSWVELWNNYGDLRGATHVGNRTRLRVLNRFTRTRRTATLRIVGTRVTTAGWRTKRLPPRDPSPAQE